MITAASAVVTGALIAYSVLSGNGPETTGDIATGPSSGATAAPEAPDEAVPPPPGGADISEVGETRSGANSDSTLLQVRKVPAPPARSAPAGMEWFGIRARTCVHADAGPSGGVPWSAWVVETNAATRYRATRVPWDDFPAQQYATTRLDPGTCNIGWVLVAVPQGTSRDVVLVTFTPGNTRALEWSV